jgi:hypothetical protein
VLASPSPTVAGVRVLPSAGPAGKSAYEIAVANGFVGTEVEWLATLPGQDGDAGLSAYQVAVLNGFVGSEAEWLATLPGADGAPGASASLWPYKANANQTIGNPGARYLLWDHATQASATHLHVSHLTTTDLDIDLFLALLQVGEKLIVQDANLSENYQQWEITAAPVKVVAAQNYWIIPVLLLDAAGTGITDFPNNHDIYIAWLRAGSVEVTVDAAPAKLNFVPLGDGTYGLEVTV